MALSFRRHSRDYAQVEASQAAGGSVRNGRKKVIKIEPNLERPMSVEVVCCTYNGEKFIQEQLRSICAQTASISRVAVYDDRSVDRTCAIAESSLRSIANRGTEVSIVQNATNFGYAKNFEQAISRATGDLLFLADQDDVWRPNKVELMTAALGRAHADLAFCDGQPIDAAGREIGAKTVLQLYGFDFKSVGYTGVVPLRTLLRRNFVNGAAIAVRRTVAQAALPIPDGIPHDYWLTLSAAAKGCVVLLPQCLYLYRQHEHNAIGLGLSKLRYRIASSWRSALTPRIREAQRWERIVSQLSSGVPRARYELLEQKSTWLQSGMSCCGSRAGLLAWILKSALSGKYRQFAEHGAVWRDLIAVLKP